MANTNSSPRNFSSRSAVDDPSSPYFLHHSYNPGLVLVSQPLTGDNFTSWSRSMRIVLFVKNKLGFIDGSIPKPPDSEMDLLNAWVRNNNIVISWLLNSVSKEISASILFAESAKEIWIDLKDRFQQSNGPRIFQLRRDLINFCQGQDSVSVYFTRIKALWEELNQFRPICSCGKCSCEGVRNTETYFQMDYTMTFLMGLNDSFWHVRSQILIIDPMPPISRVFVLIIQEERQRSIGNQSITNDANHDMAFALKGEQTWPQFNNRARSKFPKERPFCTSCNIAGHTIETCYKIHGYPPGYKTRHKSGNKGYAALIKPDDGQSCQYNTRASTGVAAPSVFQNLDKTQVEQLMSMFLNQFTTSEQNSVQTRNTNLPAVSVDSGTCFSISIPRSLHSSICWIVDSGASRHICSNANAFISLKAVANSRVTLPNNASVDVRFYGDIRLGSSSPSP